MSELQSMTMAELRAERDGWLQLQEAWDNEPSTYDPSDAEQMRRELPAIERELVRRVVSNIEYAREECRHLGSMTEIAETEEQITEWCYELEALSVDPHEYFPSISY